VELVDAKCTCVVTSEAERAGGGYVGVPATSLGERSGQREDRMVRELFQVGSGREILSWCDV
jgi:hypothetical protein